MNKKTLEVTKKQLEDFSKKTFFSSFDIENINFYEEGEKINIYCNLSDSEIDFEEIEDYSEYVGDDGEVKDFNEFEEWKMEKYEERRSDELYKFYNEIDNFFGIDSSEYYETDSDNVWIVCIFKYDLNELRTKKLERIL